tara:strand:- start:1121 stop:1330 length:210 start_codon:yes stop_codon:yes gene_type:complete
MSNDRHGTKHNVNAYNYTFSGNDDRIYHTWHKDDYKFTITVDATYIQDSKKTEESNKREKGTKETRKED